MYREMRKKEKRICELEKQLTKVGGGDGAKEDAQTKVRG